MKSLRTLIFASLRWGWFGLLVLLAFGYLVAGLSDSNRRVQPNDMPPPNDSAAQPTPPTRGDAEALTAAIARVDRQWTDSLAAQGIDAASPADWLTVCRRISLALVGNGLSLEEIRSLQQLPEPARVATHLDRLLVDPRYHAYWGERWTRLLVGTDNGQFIVYRRRRFRIWLTEVFAANERYDRMVRRLITAEGLWTDKPEVNFLTATFDSNDNQADPIRLAARTSRAFLGLRIDCLQCHDDFLGNVSLGDVDQPREGRQSDFHQLAAFYSSAKTNGLLGVRSGPADYQYQYLDTDKEVAVEPAVPYAPQLLPTEGDARQRLATWVTSPENRQAARAAVSHVWALMYGQAAGESVDNLPLDSRSHPALEALTDEFIAADFNIRRLIRMIVGSSAFQVDSRSEFEITPLHERQHAVFPLVRLRPEQVAGSIIQAARIKKTDRESSLFLQLQTLTGTNDFVRQYGDMGEDEFTTDSVTITQRLLMMNGKVLRELVGANPLLNTTGHVNMFAASDSQAVETLYLTALNRYPTDSESKHFVGRLQQADNREQTLEDLQWVLLNSSELAWNH